MKFRILFVAALVLYGAAVGCGKKASTQNVADSTATDSTSLANAKGSMEGDGENFGQNNEASFAAERAPAM